MAINKKAEFSAEDLLLADYMKALSHPARVAILRILAERNECICGEIVDILPLAQATVSQHLKELKNIGLVKGEIDGVKTCYCINWEKMAEFKTVVDRLQTYMNDFKIKPNCC
jgi:ArsR family transcriptional regulator, arsenate/arsenite/antimonite-responsive transcriptional repressor